MSAGTRSVRIGITALSAADKGCCLPTGPGESGLINSTCIAAHNGVPNGLFI